MITRKISRVGITALFISFTLQQLAIAGYSMTPLITTFDLSQKSPSAVVEIKSETGDAKIPMAIELKVKGRDVSVDGASVTYKNDKSEDNFVVYPSQIVLMPGETQRVQIKWVGDGIPKQEIAYALIASQAPVKLGDEDAVRKKAEGRLQILVQYEGAIIVIPPGAKPHIIVDSVSAKNDKDGKPRLIIAIRNDGTGRQKLPSMKLQVTPKDKDGKLVFKKSIPYKPNIATSQTRQSLFPGYSRLIDVEWPQRLPVGPVTVTVEFDQEN